MYSYLSKEDQAWYAQTVDRWRQEGAAVVPWVTRDRSRLASRSLKRMCQEIEAAQASEFFTARVHAALVASGMGLGGELQALDSRALSAQLYGVDLVGRRAEAFCHLSDQFGSVAPPPADIEGSIRSSLEALL